MFLVLTASAQDALFDLKELLVIVVFSEESLLVPYDRMGFVGAYLVRESKKERPYFIIVGVME